MQNEPPADPQNARPPIEIRLPAVSSLLQHPAAVPLVTEFGAGLVTDLLRERLDELRRAALDSQLNAAELQRVGTPTMLLADVHRAARGLCDPRPRTVINATGIVVHTNLGRATLSEAAARRLAEDAAVYVDLEYELGAGQRGRRLAHLDPLMRRLFPASGFTVVNNNAAAIMLCLHALGAGREVVVSRGELVEIGGSFRVPEMLAAAGVKLREVGTTNRTRRADYEQALSPQTALILKVHPSNFRIEGFTEQASVEELAGLSRRAGLPLVVDWGSGDLVDLAPLQIHDEIPVGRIVAAGADLVTFSGDKLLGGPQAGFVVGREDLVRRLERDPLARALRLDRLRLGALQRTLSAYATGRAFTEIPTLRMLSAEAAEIGERAARVWGELLRRIPGADGRVAIIDGVSRSGGGSSPGGERPTRLLAVSAPEGDAGSIERRLRLGEPPIVGRLHDGRLLLDLRTVLPSQEDVLIERLAEALG